jgi:uncharacterized small protein (DUF1192 family)
MTDTAALRATAYRRADAELNLIIRDEFRALADTIARLEAEQGGILETTPTLQLCLLNDKIARLEAENARVWATLRSIANADIDVPGAPWSMRQQARAAMFPNKDETDADT